MVRVSSNRIKDLRVTPMTVTYEEYLNSTYVPDLGEIVVITNYKEIVDDDGNIVKVPTYTVGDGVTILKKLIIAGNYSGIAEKAEVAQRLEHSITIGEHVFDGSQDVEVGIYDGDYEI